MYQTSERAIRSEGTSVDHNCLHDVFFTFIVKLLLNDKIIISKRIT